MSIATVITEGFGSFGDITHVILSGYNVGQSTPTDTHDGGFTKKEYEKYLKRLRRRAERDNARFEAEKAKSLQLRRDLRGEPEIKIEPPVEIPQEIEVKSVPAELKPLLPQKLLPIVDEEEEELELILMEL